MGFFKRIRSAFGKDQEPALKPRTLVNLKVGDIVSYELIDYQVEGVTLYLGGTQQRYGYLLNDAGNRRFLLVESKETIRAFLYENIQARLENPEAVNYEMVYDGVHYYEKVRGESKVDVIGKSAFHTSDLVYWWMHLSDDGRGMLIEWQNGETIIRVGAPIKAEQVTIFAASE